MSTEGVNNNSSPSSITMWESESALAAELGGDVNAQVAAMVLKHGQDKRAAARQMRHVQEDQLRAFEAEQVAKLREQAKHLLAAAQRAAFGKIASGGLQIGGGALTVGSAGPARDAEIQKNIAANTTGDASKAAAAAAGEAKASLAVADGSASVLKGAGTGAEAGTELWAASANDAAKKAEIASTVAEHKAQEAKRRMEDLKDDEQDGREMTKKAFDFLKDVQEAQAAIERAALSSRA